MYGVFAILFLYWWCFRQFPPELSYPVLFLSHPKGFTASACCRGIVATVITNTPNNAAVASIAIVASDVPVVSCRDVAILNRPVIDDRKIKGL